MIPQSALSKDGCSVSTRAVRSSPARTRFVANPIASSLAVARRKRSSAAASLSPVRPPPYFCEAHNRTVAADPVLFVDVELGTGALRARYVRREMPAA